MTFISLSEIDLKVPVMAGAIVMNFWDSSNPTSAAYCSSILDNLIYYDFTYEMESKLGID